MSLLTRNLQHFDLNSSKVFLRARPLFTLSTACWVQTQRRTKKEKQYACGAKVRKQKVSRITAGDHSRERCWDVGEAEVVKLVHKGEWTGRRGPFKPHTITLVDHDRWSSRVVWGGMGFSH